MKTAVVLISLLSIFASCTQCTDDDVAKSQKKQCDERWQLTSISGSIANVPPLNADELPWQEWYVFNDDNSFTRTRQEKKSSRVEAGTYEVKTLTDGIYFELTYENDNDLIGNCTADNREVLRENNGKLVNTWMACDGSGLTYEKKTSNCAD
jgi:hypothetical protein